MSDWTIAPTTSARPASDYGRSSPAAWDTTCRRRPPLVPVLPALASSPRESPPVDTHRPQQVLRRCPTGAITMEASPLRQPSRKTSASWATTVAGLVPTAPIPAALGRSAPAATRPAHCDGAVASGPLQAWAVPGDESKAKLKLSIYDCIFRELFWEGKQQYHTHKLSQHHARTHAITPSSRIAHFIT